MQNIIYNLNLIKLKNLEINKLDKQEKNSFEEEKNI